MPKIGQPILKPYWQTSDKKTVRLYQGDVIEVLRKMPAKSVQMICTSPPYWGLRDYGTAEWEGGDEGCDHSAGKGGGYNEFSKGRHFDVKGQEQKLNQYKGHCPKCGAKRIDQQIGSEQTPEEFVAKMVEVFGEVRRVLRDDGTVWLNLGDSIPKGQLTGAPWRVALALQADGWILRQDIIWAKLSPMSESVRNRCTKSHEYIFMLVKKQGYYCDMEAVRENSPTPWHGVSRRGGILDNDYKPREHFNEELERNTRNKRSVWNIASESYSGAHFATFPRKLIEPCILAGTSERGCCSNCGAPWKRVVERDRQPTRPGINNVSDITGKANRDELRHVTETKTTGWEPGCDCNAEVVPCTVMDIFVGSGTSCCVSLANGRHSIGIDLSEKYLRDNAIPRIEGELLSRPSLAHLTGKKAERVELGDEI